MPLLADEDLAVAKRYGVTGWLGPLARLTELKDAPGGRYVMRAIFVIDGEGIVRHRHVSRTGAQLPVGRRPRAGASPRSADGRRAAAPFAVAARRRRCAARAAGEGPPIVLCHGITATRRYVLHGSRALERAGYAVDHLRRPRPRRVRPGPGRARVMDTRSWSPTSSGSSRRQVGEGAFVLGGHSMGAHTAVAYALRHPERLAGLVVIGPVYAGDDLGRSRSSTGTGSPRRSRRAGSTASSTTSTSEQGIDPRLARLGAALHPRADAAPPPSRGARRGAARGAALAALRVAGRARVARGPGAGRRQPRRRRPRPSLRGRRGLRRARCRGRG